MTDRARLEALYAQHAAAVHAYARRRTDPASAEDVVAETFLVAWRRRERVPAADPLPWLFATARHVLANQRRGDARRAALSARMAAEAPRGGGAAGGGGRREEGAAGFHELGGSGAGAEGGPLLRALATLRPADREALLLTAWEGLTPERAAAALECSRAAFHVRVHRARRRLAAAMERERKRTTAASPPPEETVGRPEEARA